MLLLLIFFWKIGAIENLSTWVENNFYFQIIFWQFYLHLWDQVLNTNVSNNWPMKENSFILLIISFFQGGRDSWTLLAQVNKFNGLFSGKSIMSYFSLVTISSISASPAYPIWARVNRLSSGSRKETQRWLFIPNDFNIKKIQ